MQVCHFNVNFKNTETPELCPGKRNILVGGVAQLLHQRGFYGSFIPSVDVWDSRGFEISWLNVTRDLLRENWNPRTIVSTFRELNSFLAREIVDIKLVEEFLEKDYHQQCEMLFNFHFGTRENAKQWLKEQL
jgi:hypothetical protein